MPKRHIAPLLNGNTRLRLLEFADLPMTLAWRNQDDIRRWFFHSQVITPEEHRAWWERYQERDDDLVFVIEETQSLNRPVGQAALYNIDRVARTAEFGRLMIGDPVARGLGIARLATARLVEEGLTAWGLEAVRLEVLSDNAPAIAIYRSCGFREVGRHDGVLMLQRRRDP